MTLYPNGIDNPTTLPPATGDDAISVNANIAATEAIETELGILPAGVYSSVRTRLDILEARINNPFAPSPDVTNPFFIGTSGVSIQDGYGDPNVRGILGTPGSLFLRIDGYNIQGLYSFRDDGAWHQIDTDPWTAAGDLSGTIYSQTVRSIQGVVISGTPAPGYVLEATSPTAAAWQSTGASITLGGDATGPADANTVINIHGASVPVSGSLTTGNVLQVSGPSALIYAPINLAGGANFVTGVLPIGNQASQNLTLTGDVIGTGTTAGTATTVHSIQGVVISGTPSAGYVLEATSSTAASWQSTGSSITLGGDVTGPADANTIVDIQGTPITISAPVLGNYVYYGPTHKLINGSLGTLKIEWFSPTTSDLGIALQAAHDSLDGYAGGVIDARGLKGSYTLATQVNINRPIHLLLDAVSITSTANIMFVAQDNFSITGKDNWSTKLNLANDGYCVQFLQPYNHISFLDPTYGSGCFLFEKLYVFGGQTAISSVGFNQLGEANINIKDCTFNSCTGYALYINDSFFYSRVERCMFEFCFGSASVQSFTETLFRDNIHAVQSGGGSQLQLYATNFVNVENDRFFGFVPNTNPDIELITDDTFSWTAGFNTIKNCQFRAERENWLNKNRVRIKTTSQSTTSQLNGTINTIIDGCWFLGPDALQILSIGRSSGVVTATISCPWPSGHGLQVGDQIQVVTAMTDSSFLGTFTVTAVGTPGTSQTVSWAQAGSNSSQTNKNGFIISLETSAIQWTGPIGRFIVTNNNFFDFAFAVDDSLPMPLYQAAGGVTRDYMDRSVFSNNTIQGSIGYQSQEFKTGGRFFSKVEVGEDSPLVGFNTVPQNKETVLLQNLIADSENQSVWDIVGACSVATGAVDPLGTNRACYITRTGAANFCSQTGGITEGIQLGFNLPAGTTMSYVKFWAKGTAETPLASFNILAEVSSVANMVAFRTISLSENWKEYQIPIVWQPGTTAAFIGYAPGDTDAMVADGYVWAFQVSNTPCDYVPTLGSAYSDPTFGSFYQKPIGFNNGMSIGSAGLRLTIPDPANLFLTEAQSYSPLLDCGGALTAERFVIPAVFTTGMSWLVKNNTTGGFPIIFANGGGQSEAIPPGQSRLIFTDGVGIFDITTIPLRTVVTSTITSYDIVPTDQLIAVGAISGVTTIVLPASPILGDTYEIKDVTGVASIHNIIVSGNGNNIDGSSTYTLVMNYAALTVTFTGVEWSVV